MYIGKEACSYLLVYGILEESPFKELELNSFSPKKEGFVCFEMSRFKTNMLRDYKRHRKTTAL